MNTLTKAERAAVIRAARMIDMGRERSSCFALDAAAELFFSDIRMKYADFYLQDPSSYWPGLGPDVTPETQMHRVMLLLTFAEMG